MNCPECQQKNLEIAHMQRRLEGRAEDFSRSYHTRQIMAEKERTAVAQRERDRLRVEVGELRARNVLLSQALEEATEALQ